MLCRSRRCATTSNWPEALCFRPNCSINRFPCIDVVFAENVDLWSSCTLRYAAHHLAVAELSPTAAAAGQGAVAAAAGGAAAGQGTAEDTQAQPSPLQLLADAVLEPVPEGATSAQVRAGLELRGWIGGVGVGGGRKPPARSFAAELSAKSYASFLHPIPQVYERLTAALLLATSDVSLLPSFFGRPDSFLFCRCTSG